MTSSNYVMFGQNDAMFCSLKPVGTSIIKRCRLKFVYVILTQTTYVDKTRKSETPNLWHGRLRHMSYYKLKVMIKKVMFKGLPQLYVKEDIVCV